MKHKLILANIACGCIMQGVKYKQDYNVASQYKHADKVGVNQSIVE